MLAVYPEEAGCDFSGALLPEIFTSHDDALESMQKKWRTKTIVMMVPGTDRRRVLDAWDGSVAHQLFFGTKYATKEVVDQLIKDKYLIENGKVRHVIWHFFVNPRTGTGGPSRALRIQLRRAGIGTMIYPGSTRQEVC